MQDAGRKPCKPSSGSLTIKYKYMNESQKWFTIIKVGYTVGIYGCSGEYFTVIVNPSSNKWVEGVDFYGMYGSEDRVAHVLKDAGYEEKYSRSNFGRMTLKDVRGRFLSETEAITKLKEVL